MRHHHRGEYYSYLSLRTAKCISSLSRWYFGQDHIKPVGIKIKVIAADTGAVLKHRKEMIFALWCCYIEVSVLLSTYIGKWLFCSIALTHSRSAHRGQYAICCSLHTRFAQSNLAIKLRRRTCKYGVKVKPPDRLFGHFVTTRNLFVGNTRSMVSNHL